MANVPIKDNKVYGDETALQRVKLRPLKEANGEVPVARRDAGRPANGPLYRGAPRSTADAQAPEMEASPYSDLYHALGRAARVKQVGDNMAADPMAGPWLLDYQARASDAAMRAGNDVRENTPYFEE